MDERARRVAKCSQEVCTSLIEETLNADVALLVEEILAAELQRAHKYIKRYVRGGGNGKREKKNAEKMPSFVRPGGATWSRCAGV